MMEVYIRVMALAQPLWQGTALLDRLVRCIYCGEDHQNFVVHSTNTDLTKTVFYTFTNTHKERFLKKILN
jgi:hypothetical protein